MGERTTWTVLDGLVFTEGPRWHDGALWCSDMHDHRVLRIDLGTDPVGVTTVAEVPHDEPSGLGWLPDGRLLVVAMETQRLLRVEAGGRVVEHADLSGLARGSVNDMIVAADGTAYVGDMGARIHDPASPRVPGQTIGVRPDGTVWCAADGLASPNGHVLTGDGRTLIVGESGAARLTAFTVGAGGTLADRRTFAPVPVAPGARLAAPDGICLDAEGAVWVADPIGARVVRVVEGGEVTDEVRYPGRIPFACVLGGPDRRTLLACTATSWRRDEARAQRAGRIEACAVEVPGAGRP